MVPPTLTTGRLRLRQWRDADLEPFAALNADPLVMEHFPAPLDRARSDAMATRSRGKLAEHGFGIWAVEAPGAAPFLGCVGLSEPSFSAHFTPCIEILWRFARDHWGHGYATEAASAVLAHAFGPLGLREVVAFTAVRNVRSRRVMERLGMHRLPTEDFDHPNLPESHPIRRHVLYRLGRAQS